jgi:hypothetical protein
MTRFHAIHRSVLILFLVLVVQGCHAIGVKFQDLESGESRILLATIDGRPFSSDDLIGGVMIEIHRSADNSQVGRFRSQSDGPVMIEGLAPGHYRVDIEIPEYELEFQRTIRLGPGQEAYCALDMRRVRQSQFAADAWLAMVHYPAVIALDVTTIALLPVLLHHDTYGGDPANDFRADGNDRMPLILLIRDRLDSGTRNFSPGLFDVRR